MPTMSTEQVITVTWMDGQTEQYDHVVTYRVADGMLTIVQAVKRGILDLLDPGAIKPRLPKTLHLPLANIRAWKDVVGMPEPEPEPEPEQKHWSKEDMRLWIITFGATLAANIATVVFIAAAVSLLHFLIRQQPNHQLSGRDWVAATYGFIPGVLGLAFIWLRWQKAFKGSATYWTWAPRMLLAISVISVLLFGLVFLGEAAGIK